MFIKKRSSFLVGILVIILFLIPLFVFADEIHHVVNCCRLTRNINLDDVTVCGPPVGQPLGCDPDPDIDPNCCQRLDSYVFNEDQVVGEATEGITQCWLGNVKQTINVPTPSWGMVCLLNSIYNVTDWVFRFALVLSVLVGLAAGFLFMTAGGDPRKLEQSKNILFWMIIGVVIAVLEKLVPSIIMSVIS